MTKSIIRIIVLTVVFAIALIGCIDDVNPFSSNEKKLTGSVSITGTAQVGQTLSANTGNLGGSGVITFQWQRGGVVVGHNNSMYVVQAGDVGHTITVTVTRSENTGSVTSGATARVIDLPVLTINYDSRGGTVSPAASESRVFPGTPVNIRATPASGYRFNGWSVTSGTATFGNRDSASTTVTLSEDAAIRANFLQLVTLTVGVSPWDRGTVSPTSQSDIVPGTWVDIMATPASGYEFVNWTVSGSGTAEFGNADNASTRVRLSSNVTVTANFRQTFTLTVNANPADGGWVGRCVTCTMSYHFNTNSAAGTPINITALPIGRHRFVNWTVVSGTAEFGDAYSASTTVTLSTNATIRANFQQTYTLTVNASHTAGGTVSPTSQSGFVFGTITAAPANNYKFVNWTVVSGTAEFGDADNASTTVTLSANATIMANFQWEIIDGGTLTYSGQNYRTVIIGGKRWMAENLNFAGSGGNLGVCYHSSPSNCNIYGRLYTFAEAMDLPLSCNSYSSSCANQIQSDHQGACPVGWRVPTDADWTTLINFVGSPADTKLKSLSGWNNNSNGTDEFGFSALPGGELSSEGNYMNVGDRGRWWSASSTHGWGSFFYIDRMTSNIGGAVMSFGFSVRCLQDVHQ